MRQIACMCLLFALGSCKPDTFFIAGTAVLPDCSEAPVDDLSGKWFDNGVVTILSEGCPGASTNDVFEACALDWVLTQEANEVSIVVDNEYRIEGRLCGDQLYLRGGWWLPVVDGDFGCTYEDDSAEEVGILQEGSVLTVDPNVPAPTQEDPNATETNIVGTLQVQGRCRGQYEVVFRRSTRPENI